MAYPDDLLSIRDNILAELKAETARRAALVAAGNPAPVTYSVKGRSMSYTEYVTAMLDAAREAEDQALAAGADGGLYEERTRGYT